MAGFAVGVGGVVKVNFGPTAGYVAIRALAGPVAGCSGVAGLAVVLVGVVKRNVGPIAGGVAVGALAVPVCRRGGVA